MLWIVAVIALLLALYLIYNRTFTKGWHKWAAIGAVVVLAGYGLYKRYEYSQWATKVQEYEVHLFNCHLASSHAPPSACPGSNHVPPPPPPPPWY